jgi:hypothetical protein
MSVRRPIWPLVHVGSQLELQIGSLSRSGAGCKERLQEFKGNDTVGYYSGIRACSKAYFED